jgi:hypothetical protein
MWNKFESRSTEGRTTSLLKMDIRCMADIVRFATFLTISFTDIQPVLAQMMVEMITWKSNNYAFLCKN